MSDILNVTALVIGYVVMIVGGLAATSAFAWWCLEIVVKYADWSVDLHRAIKFYRESKRKEFPAS